MQRLGFERLRRRDAQDRARNLNSGYSIPTLPAKVAAARKRLEDLAMARELGIPVESFA
jgi:hypothetical protein